MDVDDVRRNAAGEVERRLGHGERAAGVEGDADAAAHLAKGDEFGAGEVLVVLDAEAVARVLRARPPFGQYLADTGVELAPSRAGGAAVAAEDGAEAEADSARPEEACRAEGGLHRPHQVDAGADDGDLVTSGEAGADSGDLGVRHRPQPGVEDLHHLRPDLVGDIEQTSDSAARRVAPRRAATLQPENPG